jgi:hypothetical protein
MAPVANASVSGVKLFAPNVSFSTSTDFDGYYQVDLSDGDYSVTVSASGYIDTTGNLQPNGTPLVVDFALNPPGTISGAVHVHGSGVPVADAVILVTALQPGIAGGQAKTQADGSYEITNLGPGDYKACLSDRNDAYLDQCYSGNDLDASGQIAFTTLSLAPGQAMNGIDFDLHIGSTISGILHDRYFGKPVADAPVYVTVLSSTKGFVTQSFVSTDASGNYVIAGVPAGNYYVASGAFALYGVPNLYYTQAFHAAGECAGPCTIDDATLVAVSETATGVDVDLQPGHVLTGKITDAATNLGIAGVRVQACEWVGLFNVTASTTTEPDGTYTLAHALGNGGTSLFTENRLGYIDNGWPDNPIYGNPFCGAFTGGSPTFTDPNQQLSGVDFALTSGAAIAGRVTAVEYPSIGLIARVRVWQGTDQGLVMVWSGDTDADGNYESSGLQLGTYYVVSRLDDDVQCQVYAGYPCDGNVSSGIDSLQSTPIILDSDATHTGVDLQFGVSIFANSFD